MAFPVDEHAPLIHIDFWNAVLDSPDICRSHKGRAIFVPDITKKIETFSTIDPETHVEQRTAEVTLFLLGRPYPEGLVKAYFSVPNIPGCVVQDGAQFPLTTFESRIRKIYNNVVGDSRKVCDIQFYKYYYDTEWTEGETGCRMMINRLWETDVRILSEADRKQLKEMMDDIGPYYLHAMPGNGGAEAVGALPTQTPDATDPVSEAQPVNDGAEAEGAEPTQLE